MVADAAAVFMSYTPLKYFLCVYSEMCAALGTAFKGPFQASVAPVCLEAEDSDGDRQPSQSLVAFLICSSNLVGSIEKT